MKRRILLFLLCILKEARLTEICKPTEGHCIKADCDRETVCDKGFCEPDGSCHCHPCFDGKNCSQFVDEKYPHFEINKDTIYIDHKKRGVIYHAWAIDEDNYNTCKLGDQSECPCGQVHYQLGPDDLESQNGPFEIDDATGALSVKEDAGLRIGQTYSIDISASNYRQNELYNTDILSLDIMKLSVVVNMENEMEKILEEEALNSLPGSEKNKYTAELNMNHADNNFVEALVIQEKKEELNMNPANYNFDEAGIQEKQEKLEMNYEYEYDVAQPHIRRKRASLGTTSSANNLTLNILNSVPAILQPGVTIQFELVIILPTIASMDLLVEIYVMDTVSGITTFALCGATVKPLPSTVTSTLPRTPVFSNNEFLPTITDRASINFGLVTNTDPAAPQGPDYSASTIRITFDAVMIQNIAYTNTSAIVTAGAEYDVENFVWVSQASFPYGTSSASYPSTVTFMGPATVPAQSVGLFQLDASISDPMAEAVVEIITPFDIHDKYSIASVTVVLGNNHKCLNFPSSTTFYKSVTGLTNHRALYSFTLMTSNINYANLAGEALDAGNALSVTFSLLLMDAIPGEQLSIAAGINIGNTKIWAGTGNFTVGSPVTPSPSPATMSLLTSHGVSQPPPVATGQTVTYSLKFNLATTQGGFVQITCTATGNAPNSICGVQYGVSGGHSGYAPSINDSVTYTSAGAATWDILVQTPYMHSSVTLNPAEAYIAIDVTVLAASTASPIGSVTCGASTTNFDVIPAAAGTADMDGTAELLGLNNLWYEGSQAAMLATFTFPANGAPYSAVSMETSGDFIVTSFGARICKVDLVRVGRGAACVLKSFWNRQNSITYKKATATSIYNDSISMAIGGMCGSYIKAAAADDNDVSIRIVYDVPLGQTTTATVFNLSIGMMLDTTIIWTGWADYSFLPTPTAVPTLPAGTIFSVPPAESPTTEMAKTFVVPVMVKVVPGSVGRYKLTVTSGDVNSLRICRIIFLNIGSNFGCIDMVPYGKHNNPDQTVIVKTLSYANYFNAHFFDTGIVRNFGSGSIYSAYNIPDEDTILFGVVIRGMAVGTFSFTAALDYGGTPPAPIVVSKTFTAVTATTTGSVTISTSGVDGTLLYYNDVMKEFFVILNVTDGYTANLTVEIINPTPADMFLCYAAVVFAGVNVPCVVPSTIVAATSADGTKITVPLDYVCYLDVTDNITESQIWIRAGVLPTVGVATTTVNINLLEAGVSKATTSVLLNSGGVYVEGNISLAGFDLYLFNNTTVTTVEPGWRFWEGVYLQLPSYVTVPVELGVITQSVNGHAAITVHGFRWGDVIGSNIGCPVDSELYSVQLLQNASTDSIPMIHESQTDTMVIDLKYLTNTGVSHMLYIEQPVDDLVLVEADIWIADHEDFANGAIIKLSFCLKVGSLIVITEKEYTLVKPATDNVMVLKNEFFFTDPTVNENTVFKQGEKILLTGRLQHVVNESHIEAYDARVRVQLPSYVKFANSSYAQLTAPSSADSISINITSIDNFTTAYVEFNIQNLFFTDILEFNLTVTVDPYNDMPKGLGPLTSTALMRLVCMESSSTAIFKYCGPTLYVNYVVQGTDCYEDLLINTFQTYQFSASTAIDSTVTPDKAASTGWSPAVRDSKIWSHHITIDFEKKTRVTKIEFFPVGSKRTVATFKLQHSSDGIIFLDACPNSLPPGLLPSTCIIEARFGRIVILTLNDLDETKAIGVRFQWFGCYLGANESTINILPPTPLTTTSDNWRHAVYDSAHGIVYVCDYSPTKEKMTCFSSTDGSSWNALPSYIGRMAGFDPITLKMYAWDLKKRSMVASEDGVTWGLVDSVTQASLALSLTPPKPIPGFEKATFTSVPIDDIDASSWTADFDGLLNGGVYKVKWNSCCS